MTTDKMLIIAVTALAGVIAFLFKLMLSQGKEHRGASEAMIKERGDWQLERAKLASDATLERQRIAAEIEIKEVELRADYEKRYREILERYDSIARADSRRMLDHEDQVRKEFAQIMETVAAQNEKSNEALVQMLNKFYERLVGPRPHY